MKAQRTITSMFVLLALAISSSGKVAFAQEGGGSTAPQVEIVPQEWLVLPSVDGRGRRPFRPDAVLARYVLPQDAPAPQAGETVTGERGEKAWEEKTVDDKGRVGGRLGYAYTEVESDIEQVLMAQLNGASTLLIDGVPYGGDYYDYGWGGVPVKLAAGVNRVFVTGIRGSFRLQFREPTSPLVVGTWDLTLPDYELGSWDGALAIFEPELHLLAGILVLNASTERMPQVTIWTEHSPLEIHLDSSLRALEPMQVRKFAVPIGLDLANLPTEAGEIEVPLRIVTGGRDQAEPLLHTIRIPVREPGSLRRHTFRSAIDDSVQEFCVKPPGDVGEVSAPMRLLLSTHGAGVGAWGQAACYPAYSDFWHVAATNRRPFGFDWQDWGRTDAYEVLEHALVLSGVERRYVHLGGHSMGGHGVWHLAANDPDGFASIAPSAGWRSFDTYGGRPEGELRALWHAADAASDTEALVNNLLGIPTYILHGDKDDNVPASEALAMRDLLTERGAPPRMHLEPGKGHWWDAGIGPGTDCLAWPGFYEMFRSSEIPRAPREIDFTSVDPDVDADHFWVHVAQPLRYGESLRVRGTWTPEARRIELTTENAARLRVTAPGWNGIETVVLDGRELAVDREAGSWWFRKAEAEWEPGEGPAASAKRPGHSGPLKRAFANRFLLVVPTGGTELENARALESARFHGEHWQYRGNGDAPIVTDAELLSAGLWQRNLILFGNRDTNRAWTMCVPDECPVDVVRGAVLVDDQRHEGDDLGALFVQPRKHDPSSLVGVFATTGPQAELLTTTLAPFVSGVGYPDYTVYDSTVLTAGDGGVLAAGWFDAAWRLQTDDR